MYATFQWSDMLYFISVAMGFTRRNYGHIPYSLGSNSDDIRKAICCINHIFPAHLETVITSVTELQINKISDYCK
jgi:hypothetical protein